MKSFRQLSLFFVCFLFACVALADTGADLQNAEEAYRKGDYETAINTYEQLLAKGSQSADLHYNLGNAYYRSKDLGKAILHLEKAVLLNPRDKDFQHNLRVVKQNLPDQFETIPPFFIQRWWDQLQAFLSPTGWGIVGLLLLWGGIAGLILWLRAESRSRRKQGFMAGIAALILCILPFAIGFSTIKEINNTQRAVILVAETNLKSAPDEISEAILQLHAGVSLTILDEIGDWKKIRLSNGEEGWVKTNTLGFI